MIAFSENMFPWAQVLCRTFINVSFLLQSLRHDFVGITSSSATNQFLALPFFDSLFNLTGARKWPASCHAFPRRWPLGTNLVSILGSTSVEDHPKCPERRIRELLNPDDQPLADTQLLTFRLFPLRYSYHWALLSGPKKDPESGYRHVMYHAKEKLIVDGDPKVARSVWEYSAETDRASMLLVRIVVGKVTDIYRLEKVLRSVPLRNDKKGWNCVSWVREALHLVSLDPGALGSRVEDWEKAQETAMWYVERKKAAHRFDGLGEFDVSKPATWDMLDEKELIA